MPRADRRHGSPEWRSALTSGLDFRSRRGHDPTRRDAGRRGPAIRVGPPPRIAPSRSGRCSRAERRFAGESMNEIVLLTRVPSAGGPLLAAAARLGYEPLVISVLTFGEGRDRARFPERLTGGSWDWIAMTSRKAAEAFLEAREKGARLAGSSKLAVVGEGTAEVLRRGGVAPELQGAEPNAASLADAIAAQ